VTPASSPAFAFACTSADSSVSGGEPQVPAEAKANAAADARVSLPFQFVAAGSEVHVWRTDTGMAVAALAGHEMGVNAVCSSCPRVLDVSVSLSGELAAACCVDAACEGSRRWRRCDCD
jgi:hypothetical protein